MFHVVLGGGGGSGGGTTVITVPAEKAVFKQAGDPAYQASIDDMIYADTSAGTVEIYAPLAPVRGVKFGVVDTKSTFGVHRAVVRRNGSVIQGQAADFDLTRAGGVYMFRYDGPGTGWRVDVGGYPAASGNALTTSAVCASPVQAHRVVTFNAAGQVEHADATVALHADRALFISMGAGAAGQAIEVAAELLVSDSAWVLDPIKPIWLGLDGLPTQIDPLNQAGFVIRVELGDVLGPTQIAFRPGEPIML